MVLFVVFQVNILYKTTFYYCDREIAGILLAKYKIILSKWVYFHSYRGEIHPYNLSSKFGQFHQFWAQMSYSAPFLKNF